jgi:hypothetical protein
LPPEREHSAHENPAHCVHFHFRPPRVGEIDFVPKVSCPVSTLLNESISVRLESVDKSYPEPASTGVDASSCDQADNGAKRLNPPTSEALDLIISGHGTHKANTR